MSAGPHEIALRIRLEAITPTRVPRSSRTRTARRGYRLVLADGTPITVDDPLLASFGARVITIADEADSDALQDDAFDVGREVLLELAPHHGDRNRVRILDDAGVKCVGTVPDAHAPVVAAALDHGLTLTCVAIAEGRCRDTGERTSLQALVAPSAFCEVVVPATVPPGVERLDPRPRLVLVAAADGTLRWWDPSARLAPLRVEDLPVTDDLAVELRRLQDDWEQFLAVQDGADDIFGHWEREQLEGRALALWRRTRDELAARYAVGFKPSGATRAVYVDPPAGADDDIAF